MPSLTSGITLDQLTGTLYAVVAVMLIVVLYHLLFIVVDLRKISRRFESLTDQVENMLIKPIAILDQTFSWLAEQVERKRNKKKDHHNH